MEGSKQIFNRNKISKKMFSKNRFNKQCYESSFSTIKINFLIFCKIKKSSIYNSSKMLCIKKCSLKSLFIFKIKGILSNKSKVKIWMCNKTLFTTFQLLHKNLMRSRKRKSKIKDIKEILHCRGNKKTK